MRSRRSRLRPFGLALALALAACGRPATGRQVWFGPDMGSPDMIELFTQPQRWRAGRPHRRVGATEPYPYFSAPTLLTWVSTLRQNGFTPAFFHLDVDRAYAGRIGADVAGDLALLRASLEGQGIPFGVIFWSDVG